MSDLLRKYPLLQQLLGSVLLAIFFFAVCKPYIDSRDSANKHYMDERLMEEVIPRLDSILMEIEEGNRLLKGVEK